MKNEITILNSLTWFISIELLWNIETIIIFVLGSWAEIKNLTFARVMTSSCPRGCWPNYTRPSPSPSLSDYTLNRPEGEKVAFKQNKRGRMTSTLYKTSVMWRQDESSSKTHSQGERGVPFPFLKRTCILPIQGRSRLMTALRKKLGEN